MERVVPPVSSSRSEFSSRSTPRWRRQDEAPVVGEPVQHRPYDRSRQHCSDPVCGVHRPLRRQLLLDDDWSVVPLVHAALHGHLALSQLWHQYYESRLVVGNLIEILFGFTNQLDERAILFFGAAVFIASYLCLLALVRKYLPRRLTPIPVLVVGVVWFSVADVANALYAFQVTWYLTVFFFVRCCARCSFRNADGLFGWQWRCFWPLPPRCRPSRGSSVGPSVQSASCGRPGRAEDAPRSRSGWPPRSPPWAAICPDTDSTKAILASMPRCARPVTNCITP